MQHDVRGWLRQVSRRARPYGLPLAVSLVLGAVCVSRIMERAGGPALPLDDSFIHLQYAKRLAAGHWFSYTPDAGYSSGATSLLWPLTLAPFFVLGVCGLEAIWVVWGLGALLHAALALEVARITAGLGGRGAGLAAAAMCFAFGAHAWFAYSGMETMALTWMLARGVRVACERCELERERSFSAAPLASPWQLVALGIVAPLVRPEGILGTAMAVLVGLREARVAAPTRPSWQRVALIAAPAAGPLVLPSMHLLFAGHAASSTAMVKWLALNPYLDRGEVIDSTLANVRLLLTDLLAGGTWTWLFVPEGFVYLLFGGIIAMAALAAKRGAWWRALMVGIVIGGTLLPTTYDTMLWNRVRYIWPFGWSWLVAVTCLGAGIGEIFATRRPLLRIVSPVLWWGLVAHLAGHLGTVIDDLATSARAISRQQVALGQWARETLPADAVIGVNDTGAIAYMSERMTFDVVGLTTEGEARYWAEGSGSRFEHYEQLPRRALPTHFIVYPGWMRMPAILGERLADATVFDQSILGGKTMVAYRARHDLLGTGAKPADGAGDVLDELDVSDIRSERDHGYWRGDAEARFNVATLAQQLDGRLVADGGRRERAEDRFTLKASSAAQLVLRVRCDLALEVWVGADRIGEPQTLSETDGWQERAIDLPASDKPRSMTVRAVGPARFDSWHYWLRVLGDQAP